MKNMSINGLETKQLNEIDQNGKIKRVYEARAAVGRNTKEKAEQRKKEIKKEVKDFLRSNKRKLR